jgi:Flp pilus assembly pilin Flp
VEPITKFAGEDGVTAIEDNVVTVVVVVVVVVGAITVNRVK